MTYTVAPGANIPVAVLGKDLALTAFPLNSLCSTLTATINDTTVTINSQDVLKEILRLGSTSADRAQRTCPTMLDNYLAYADGNDAINTPLGSYSSVTGVDYVPNGAYYDIVFTDAAGAPLVGAGNYVVNAVNYPYVNGVPVGNGALTAFPLFFRFRSTEKLVLSPFVFSDVHEWDTGLFGINNIQLIMNLRDPRRVLRFDSTLPAGAGTRSLTSPIAYNTAGGSNAFENSVVNVIFLTPSLDIALPPKSVVPYIDYPRYISTPAAPVNAGATTQILSQTITLPMIPDTLLIYVKALQVTGQPDPASPQFADGYLSVATKRDGIRNPLSVNFDKEIFDQYFAVAVAA